MRADTNEWMRVCDRRRVLCADVCMNVCTSVCVGSVHRCVRVSAPASPAEGLPPGCGAEPGSAPRPHKYLPWGPAPAAAGGAVRAWRGPKALAGSSQNGPFPGSAGRGHTRKIDAQAPGASPASLLPRLQVNSLPTVLANVYKIFLLQAYRCLPRPRGLAGAAASLWGSSVPAPPHPPLGGHWAGVGGRRLSRQLPVSPATLPECSLSTGGSAAPLPRPGARSGLERVLFCVSASPEGGARGAALPDEAGVS